MFLQLEFMKNLRAPILSVILMLFSVSLSWAENNPPPPTLTVRTAGVGDMDPEVDGDGDDEGTVPVIVPGEFPIDNNIIILVIGGLTLGATVIYKNHSKKASV